MNKLFRPKTMRRMAVFMALVAPIVYLFGSLFFALNGAHGQQVFAEYDEPFSVTYSDNDLIRGYYGYTDGVYVDRGDFYTTGLLACADVSYLSFGGTPSTYSQRYIALYDADRVFVSGDNVSSTNCLNNFVLTGSYFVAVSFYNYPNPNSGAYWADASVTFHFLNDNVTYSDYIFGNFFDQDNFLVKWGENAISENPYGFAPFGYFWRYLDTNVLHLSNEQVGLMAYGYMYYAAHVLLFDVGFILVTFFLTFIQKVADRIGGEDHA